MKKRWLMISLLVGGLMVAITGGLVLAQTPDAEQDHTKQTKAGRLAEILGGDVTEESVQEAFTLMAREHQEARVEKRLNRLVTTSKMTQAEADEYMEWSESRPENIKQSLPLPGYEKLKSMKQQRGAHSRFRGFRTHREFRNQEIVPEDKVETAN